LLSLSYEHAACSDATRPALIGLVFIRHHARGREMVSRTAQGQDGRMARCELGAAICVMPAHKTDAKLHASEAGPYLWMAQKSAAQRVTLSGSQAGAPQVPPKKMAGLGPLRGLQGTLNA
jgi:hypothetical protein